MLCGSCAAALLRLDCVQLGLHRSEVTLSGSSPLREDGVVHTHSTGSGQAHPASLEAGTWGKSMLGRKQRALLWVRDGDGPQHWKRR